MFKKLMSAVAAAALCVSLAACGATATSEAAAEATATPAPAVTEAPAEETASAETADGALRVAGLKGPTTMGLVNLMAGEDAAEITTDPENYSAVVKALEEKGYEILSDDLAMVPMTTTRLTDPDQLKQMGKLLDSLEDNDDVQNVWHSLENEEDLPE